MTITNMVKQFLDANGYDGLYHPASRACKKDNLIPCGELSPLCRAGYFRKPGENDDQEAEFCIGPVEC